MEKRESLEREGTHILEETRMVLPGVQALFGFQLIAVFTDAFHDTATWFRVLHLTSMGLTVLSIILLLAPAAYHRQAEPHVFSKSFIRLSSALMTAGMFTLALGMCLEIYLIATLALAREGASLALALALFLMFGVSWYVLPMLIRRKNGTPPGRHG